MKNLAGKVAIITGASKGLGKAMALALGAEGARLFLVSRSQAQLQATAAEARALGAEAELCPADVTDEAQVRRDPEQLALLLGPQGEQDRRLPDAALTDKGDAESLLDQAVELFQLTVPAEEVLLISERSAI